MVVIEREWSRANVCVVRKGRKWLQDEVSTAPKEKGPAAPRTQAAKEEREEMRGANGNWRDGPWQSAHSLYSRSHARGPMPLSVHRSDGEDTPNSSGINPWRQRSRYGPAVSNCAVLQWCRGAVRRRINRQRAWALLFTRPESRGPNEVLWLSGLWILLPTDSMLHSCDVHTATADHKPTSARENLSVHRRLTFYVPQRIRSFGDNVCSGQTCIKR